MGIIKYVTDYFQEKRKERLQELNTKYLNIAVECELANKSFQDIFDSNQYIHNQTEQGLLRSYADLYEKVNRSRRYTRAGINPDTVDKIEIFTNQYKRVDKLIKEHNIRYIEQQKRQFKDLFDHVENRALDEQQRDCIVKDEINNLVIAGAGSGKTTTIVGKVKYLLNRYSYAPEQILVLSFTNASASEMADRIRKETGKSIDVMTFHKLGLEIITEVEGAKPSIYDLDVVEYVNEQFNVMVKNPEFFNLFTRFFLSYFKQYKSRFEFKNEGEYIEYLKDTNIRTLKNEIVKSYEEMEIANFLYLNNVKYEYEKKYEHTTKTKDYRQYTPDFYLPDYGIYIEHFGIDRFGNVPGFFQGNNEKSAKEVYNEGIEWKRQIHRCFNTKLIETYSFEKSEGLLTDKLKEKLEIAGVQLKPMTQDELWRLISSDRNNEITDFVKLLGTFIRLMKSNNYDIGEIQRKNKTQKTDFVRLRNSAFISIIEPLYQAYQRQLQKNDEIDFDDMINRSFEYVKTGKFQREYKYIIIDEYQDISMTRYQLIKAIKDKNNAKLFCVGDDWQSIYRFAGSKISLFTYFENYFGYTEKSYIETTYRFNRNLIALSSRFILKNRAQISKQLRPHQTNDEKAFSLIYGDDAKQLNHKLKEQMDKLPMNASVALIGRYKNDLAQYLGSGITTQYDKQLKLYIVLYPKRADLKIKYMTAHKSKGLQADYVFILNNTNKKHGFPSQIEDDPVLELFSQETDVFPFAEERRLFYVALTRAKKHVFLMVDKGFKSAFIREIEEDWNLCEPIEKGLIQRCPQCIKGELVLRKGRYSEFYGCSNFPLCDYTQKNYNKHN